MNPNDSNNPNIPKPLDKWSMISFSFQLGYVIALPLVAFGYAGKWLDGKYGTDPMWTITGILLAIIFTTVWLMKKFKDFAK